MNRSHVLSFTLGCLLTSMLLISFASVPIAIDDIQTNTQIIYAENYKLSSDTKIDHIDEYINVDKPFNISFNMQFDHNITGKPYAIIQLYENVNGSYLLQEWMDITHPISLELTGYEEGIYKVKIYFTSLAYSYFNMSLWEDVYFNTYLAIHY